MKPILRLITIVLTLCLLLSALGCQPAQKGIAGYRADQDGIDARLRG